MIPIGSSCGNKADITLCVFFTLRCDGPKYMKCTCMHPKNDSYSNVMPLLFLNSMGLLFPKSLWAYGLQFNLYGLIGVKTVLGVPNASGIHLTFFDPKPFNFKRCMV